MHFGIGMAPHTFSSSHSIGKPPSDAPALNKISSQLTQNKVRSRQLIYGSRRFMVTAMLYQARGGAQAMRESYGNAHE